MMFRRLSAKFKRDKDVQKLVGEERGAAVPYRDPADSEDAESVQSLRTNPSGKGGRYVKAAAATSAAAAFAVAPKSGSMAEIDALLDAASKGKLENVRQILRKGEVDVNSRDESGASALHRAAIAGQSRMVRYLLLHGADMEAANNLGHNALYLAVDNNNAGTVGMLLDYLHSVDRRPREPFVLIRARKSKTGAHLIQRSRGCSDIKPFLKQGADLIQFLIVHGQLAEHLAIFLYSVLDVSVTHAFFLNTIGEMNMKNFQRFESKELSHSMTVLNTLARIVDVRGYDHLRSLIIVSCDLSKLMLEGLRHLELLDVRHNLLESLPEGIKDSKHLKTLKCSHNLLKRIPAEIGELAESLTTLECSYNLIKRFSSQIVKCTQLACIEVDHNELIELPVDIGLLANMEELLIHNNKLSNLPLSISSLAHLKKLTFYANPLLNIPPDFPEGVAGVQQYMKALQDDPVGNTTVKLVLVGQEGVGKTTLLNALKKTFWIIPRNPHTPKTDGIDIKNIHLDDLTLRCFDCGGDVDFNETHTFFITQGALYLACFNLSEYTQSTVERSSFLLGRLQLWLQYIFSKVPNAQVLIVGTHADHSSMNRSVFEQVWEQLRKLLVSAREHHRQFFRSRHERLPDCLLCQSDSRCLRRSAAGGSAGFVNLGFDDLSSLEEETSFNDGPARVVAFPHIVGYYEVSSVKSVGNASILQLNVNQSVEHLKDAIKELSKRLVKMNASMPRKWADAQESLQNRIRMNPDHALTTIEEVAQMAVVQGVMSQKELVNMLLFFKAQGNVLYFPRLEGLEETVILDPEWLAKIFATVVSYRDTGITSEGFIDRDQLVRSFGHVNVQTRDKVVTLLRHFGLCLPISGTNLELFPCKLPLGDPDDSAWPSSPHKAERQLTQKVTLPSIIPPPFFSNLMVAVYRYRATIKDDPTHQPQYFSNQFLDYLSADKQGCSDCMANEGSPTSESAPHKVLFEMIAHTRSIQITARGHSPCCVMKKVGRILRKVSHNYEGLGSVQLDTIVCPGCYLQSDKDPHKFSIKYLQDEHRPGEKVICGNAHIMPNARSVLGGFVGDSLMPSSSTIRPKSPTSKSDYSSCPKLFTVLPVNKDGLSFDKDLQLFVSSTMFDGYAAHLMCEFPDGYHVTRAPGYRLKSPKEFMQCYGGHVVSVLRLLAHLRGSTVSPQYAGRNKAVTNTIESLIDDYRHRFPGIKEIKAKTASSLSPEALNQSLLESGKKIKRADLKKHFNMVDKPDSFGPLRRLKYGEHVLWLCSDHYRQMRVLSLGTSNLPHITANIESNA